jgi:hypothetical protein
MTRPTPTARSTSRGNAPLAGLFEPPPPMSGSSGAAPGLAPSWADVIYTEMCHARLWRDHYGDGRHTLRQEAAPMPEPNGESTVEDPRADTAGEQDHSDPWAFAGEDADPPEAA